jgi:hypothetical protein
MKRIRKIAWIGLLMCGMLASASFGIIGVGVHYGIDLTLSSDSVLNEPAVFDSLKLDLSSFLGNRPSELATATTVQGSDLPIFVNRTELERKPFNIGGKVFIDIIPVIDAIEVSSNFGLWEYKGQIQYPDSITFKQTQPTDPAAPLADRIDVHYRTLDLTLDSLGLGYVGLHGTPYAKLQFDLTVRKNLICLPKKMKILRVYAGGGPTVQFATPMLSGKLIEDALGEQLNVTKTVSAVGTDILGNKEVMKAVVEEITKNLMIPHAGMHIDVGAMVKLPVVPIGIYVDVKYMIPFGKLDKNVTISGNGILLNAGVTFGL